MLMMAKSNGAIAYFIRQWLVDKGLVG